MFLSGISLQHFRNYTNQTFFFKKPLTVIQASNATGKTNILEAIHLLSTGSSFRDGTIDDFIQIEQEFGRLKAIIVQDQEQTEIELLLTHGVVGGKKTQKKIFTLNSVKKQQRFVIGKLSCVSFIPEDLRIITGSPARRRKFLDILLCQLDLTYFSSMTTYEQALRRRNKLLQQVREAQVPRTTLSFWDQTILKHGSYIQDKRADLIQQFNQHVIHDPGSNHFSICYDISKISQERLAQYAQAELAAGHTLVGPHKDDITVNFELTNTHDKQKSIQPLSTHGSRGQQRMGVLWLKIQAFELLKHKLKTPPILLLDDIFSELDKTNRESVIALSKQTQTIMTTAENQLEVHFDQESDTITL